MGWYFILIFTRLTSKGHGPTLWISASEEQNAHADLQRHLRKEQRRGAVAQALHAALRQRLEAAHHQGDRARQELREVRRMAARGF